MSAPTDAPAAFTMSRLVRALLPAGLAERLLAMGQGQRPTDAMGQLYQQQVDQQLQQQRQQAELFTAVRPEQQPALLALFRQQGQELMQQQQYQTQRLEQPLQRQQERHVGSSSSSSSSGGRHLEPVEPWALRRGSLRALV